MKLFLQLFLIFFLFLDFVSAEQFRDVKSIRLKKDEQKKILVKYGDITKLFKFRWTLYKNGGLVIHRSYDRVVAQNILYLRDKNRSFRCELHSKGAKYYNVPYILIKFKEFDFENEEAVFELFLADRQMEIKLKYLKNS